jgi:uncharacterized protein (DUF433 family)
MPNLQTQAAPLTKDEHGVIRIVGSRITLDSVVHEFQQGATAEQIQEDFPSLALRDIYTVIAYYLQNTAYVDEYLRTRDRNAARTQAEIESHHDSAALRQRLRRRAGKAAE